MRSLLASLLVLPLSSLAGDWPHWRGASRNGTTGEDSGFEAGNWPPAELWRTKVGAGSASVLVVGGQVFALGREGDSEVVRALDAAKGEERWRQAYPAPAYGRHAIGDQHFYRGPSATPEYDAATDSLYTMGIDGELRCWDCQAGGSLRWKLNLYDEFEIPQRPQVTKRPRSRRDYGYPGSPLVVGELLIVEAGDPSKGNLLAFDKRSGKLRWSSENRDPAGHSGGPAPMVVDGAPCVAVLTALNLVVTRLDGPNAGKTVAEYPWATDFINNIPTPAVIGQSVLVSSRYNVSKTARLDISLRGGATLRWESAVATGVCSPVIIDGNAYIANKGFHCIDLGTGRERWTGGTFGDPGSLIATADDRLIAWANDGDLFLVESAKRSPDRYTELAACRGVLRDMAWPHVALADGRLFAKDRAGNLVCLSLRGEQAPERTPAPPAAGLPVAERFDLDDWPGPGAALVIGWKQGGGKRRFFGGGRHSLSLRGAAAFDAEGAMLLGGGAFGVSGNAKQLADKLSANGELTIECLLRADNVEQDGPARLLTFSESAYSRNFTLGQERDQLVLRLRTPRTGENGSKPEVKLGRLEPGALCHVIVSYRAGELICFLNGREVSRTDKVRGDFSNWTAQHLWIGDEHDGEREWKGTVYGFALFNRAFSAADAARRYAGIVGGR